MQGLNTSSDFISQSAMELYLEDNVSSWHLVTISAHSGTWSSSLQQVIIFQATASSWY